MFKNILKEYTHIQLIFHSKALEMLTIAYKELLEINTQNDLEVLNLLEFRKINENTIDCGQHMR